jgi:hypothetical protein
MNVSVKLEDAYEDLSPLIGDVTEEQVETFWRDGVVYVPGFVKPELCEEVIQHFMAWSGMRWKEWPSDPDEQKAFVTAVEASQNRPRGRFGIRQDDPWMFNYVAQRKFGEAAARLLKVPSVKILSETLHVKQPASSGLSMPLVWHQDFPSLPIDRAEAIQFWCALVDVTPEMGPMTHLRGSHRSMPGGMVAELKEDALKLYPELFEQYKPTKLVPLSQGTAVFHHGLTWHCSGINRTDKVRWAMSSYRISTRCRYTGQANFNTDGLGLTPREPFDHPNFPTVYP